MGRAMDGLGAARVALLVDGDNIRAALAGRMIVTAARLGRVMVKRVYLGQAAVADWAGAPGFRLIQAPPGKNASDMALCIEALDLAHADRSLILALATSDRDFSALALNLVEKGHTVLGLGEAKTPAHFRAACTRFHEIGESPAAPAPAPAPPCAAPDHTADRIAAVIRARGQAGAMPLGALGGRLFQDAGVRPADLPGGGLRACLAARPGLFAVDPKGPAAQVRLRGP